MMKHEALVLLVTSLPVQTSNAVAVTSVTTFGPQTLGVKKLAKSSVSPGASAEISATNPALLSLTMMSPALLTLPEKTSSPPGDTGCGGQFFVTTRRGRGTMGHCAESLALTSAPLQRLLPRAVSVSARSWAQRSVGTR